MRNHFMKQKTSMQVYDVPNHQGRAREEAQIVEVG